MNVNDKATKKRGWIKNFAIAFLAIMLVLTLFSNTIMNYSLPQVSAQYCYSGSIKTNVTGNGSVQAKESYIVTADRSFIIKDVGVQAGSPIKAGDIMFTLEDKSSDDLITEIETLTGLKKSKTELIEKMSNPEYSTALLELERLREDYNLAKDANAKLTSANLTLKSIGDEKSVVEGKISSINSNILEIEQKYKTYELLTDINEAKAAFEQADAALKNAVEAHKIAKAALDNFEKQNGIDSESGIPDGGSGDSTSTLRNLEDLMRKYQQSLDDFDVFLATESIPVQEAQKKYEEALNRAMLARTELQNGFISDEEYNKIDAEMNDALKAYGEADQVFSKAKTEYQRGLEEQAIAIERIKEDISKSEANSINSEQYSELKKSFNTAEKTLNDSSAALDKSRDLYELLKYREEKKLLDSQFADLSVRYDKAKAEADNYQSLAQTDSQMTDLKRQIEDKQRSVEALKAANENSSDTTQLELETIEAKIKIQEEKIDSLRDVDSLSQFTAPVDGTVTEINFAAGQTVNLNDTIAEIQLVDKGFMVQFALSADQAKRIRPGDIAKPQNYWGGTINAIVDNIIPDKNDPQKTKIVTVNVTGDVSIGTNLSFSIGERSQDYDMIVPISALREDNNGAFVFIVDVKSTPLGNRYKAKRADVQIIAKDNTSAAVSGLNYGDFVIITSSSPINPGTQVRMIES